MSSKKARKLAKKQQYKTKKIKKNYNLKNKEAKKINAKATAIYNLQVAFRNELTEFLEEKEIVDRLVNRYINPSLVKITQDEKKKQIYLENLERSLNSATINLAKRGLMDAAKDINKLYKLMDNNKSKYGKDSTILKLMQLEQNFPTFHNYLYSSESDAISVVTSHLEKAFNVSR